MPFASIYSFTLRATFENKLTVGVQDEVWCEWPLLPRLFEEDRGRAPPQSFLPNILWPPGAPADDAIEAAAPAGPRAEVPEERAKGLAEDITEERND